MTGDAPGSGNTAADRPFYRLLGLAVAPGQPAGHSLVTLASRPELTNSRGDVHGGAVATLLDAAMATAARSVMAPGDGVATISLTVNYLQPGTSVLEGRGKVVRAGRSVLSVEATVNDPHGIVVAHGIGTMRRIASSK